MSSTVLDATGPRGWRRLGRFGLDLGIAAAMLLFWTLAIQIGGLNRLIVPSPASVWDDVVANQPIYLEAALQSGVTIVLGIVLGVLLGSAFAVLGWWSPLGAGMARPIAEFLYATPVVVLIPIVARLVGYGDATTLAVTAVACFFPSYILMLTGLKQYPPGAFHLFGALGATKLQLLLRCALPGSAVNFMVAFRIACTLAVTSAVATEFITGTGGLGYVLGLSRDMPNGASRAWGVAILTTVIAYAAYNIATLLYERVRRRVQ